MKLLYDLASHFYTNIQKKSIIQKDTHTLMFIVLFTIAKNGNSLDIYLQKNENKDEFYIHI